MIRRIWPDVRLKPQRSDTFEYDPLLVEKVLGFLAE